MVGMGTGEADCSRRAAGSVGSEVGLDRDLGVPDARPTEVVDRSWSMDAARSLVVKRNFPSNSARAVAEAPWSEVPLATVTFAIRAASGAMPSWCGGPSCGSACRALTATKPDDGEADDRDSPFVVGWDKSPISATRA